MDKLIIMVPQLPPKEYSPNARVHWAARKRAGDNYGNEVYAEAVNARNLVNWQALEYASVKVEVVFAEERIRDEDNHRARFKPGMDALVRAGIIQFDDMQHISTRIIFAVDPERAPLTIITVTGKAAL